MLTEMFLLSRTLVYINLGNFISVQLPSHQPVHCTTISKSAKMVAAAPPCGILRHAGITKSHTCN